MRRIRLFSAVAWVAFASAASALPIVPNEARPNGLIAMAANANAAAQPASAKARALDLETRVKVPLQSLGLEQLDLNNNEIVEPKAGSTPQAVIRSGCIFPFGFIKYKLVTGAPQVYRFSVTPTRRFDVVMRIDMPGVHKTVDRFFAGGTETYRVVTFVPRLPTTIVVRGFGASSGSYTFTATP
jgi:hypothetical protein